MARSMAIFLCAFSLFLCIGGSTARHLLQLADKLPRFKTAAANYDHTALSRTLPDRMALQIEPFSPRTSSPVPVTDDKMEEIAGGVRGKSPSALLESEIDVPTGPNPLHHDESPINDNSLGN